MRRVCCKISYGSFWGSRRQSSLALGDVVGACIFNIFFILGICATVKPLNTGTISLFDFAMLAIGALAVWIFGALTGPKVISRREGNIQIALYVVYAVKLIADVIQH